MHPTVQRAVPSARRETSLGTNLRLLAALAAMACSTLAFGSSGMVILHVPAEHPTVTAALAAASNGDVIQLAPGTYTEPFAFNGTVVTIRGTPAAPHLTVLAPVGPNRSDILEIPAMPDGGTITLDGLTIGGFAAFTVAGGSLSIRDSVVTADGSGLSIAFALTNGSLVVERTTIADSGFEPHAMPLFSVIGGTASFREVQMLAGSRPLFRGESSSATISDTTVTGLTLDPLFEQAVAVEAVGGSLTIERTLFANIGPGSGVRINGAIAVLSDTDFVAVGHPFKGFDCALIADGPSTTLTDCTFEQCGSFAAQASVAILAGANTTLQDCQIVNNTLSDTGAGGLLVSGHATIVDSTFLGNSTFARGGAALVTGSAIFEGCTFAANLGGDGGGAVAIAENGSADLIDCTLMANAAGDGFYAATASGGGVLVEGGTLGLSDSTLLANIAAASGKEFGFGGGVAVLVGGHALIADTSLLHNIAMTSGGGLAIDAQSTAEVVGVSLCSNVPDQVDGDFLSLGTSLICGCEGDLSGDGTVDATDLALLLGAWGPCGSVAADLLPDGSIDAGDLALLLGAWGPCE
jgi:hypothetical protein